MLPRERTGFSGGDWPGYLWVAWSTQEKNNVHIFWAGKYSATRCYKYMQICYSIIMQSLEGQRSPNIFSLPTSFSRPIAFLATLMFAFEPQVPHKDPEFLLFMKPGLTSWHHIDIIILHFIHFIHFIMLFAWFYEAGLFSHWVVRFGSGRWVAGVKFAVRGHAVTSRTLHGLWTSRPCRRFAGSCMKLTYLGCPVWIW